MNPTDSNPSSNKKQVIFMPSGRRDSVNRGTSLLDAARQVGLEIESICGGKLTCGKCKVKIENGNFLKHGIHSSLDHVSIPSRAENELLQKLGSTQYRLSCQTFVDNDVVVFIPEEARGQKQIIRKSATERVIEINPAVKKLYIEVDKAELGEHRGDWGRIQSALFEQWNLHVSKIDLFALRKLQNAIRSGDWKLTVTIWNDFEVIDIHPGYKEGIYGLAVDVGSTTIAAYLCDLRTGDILATESMMNPQVAYGEDIMSRISYAMSNRDGLTKMNRAVISGINKLARSAAEQAKILHQDIHEIVCVGNTTMIHILLGINPSELGTAPFALANRDSMTLKAQEAGFKIHPAAYLHILPAEAGHVGADNVAVLIAEEPYQLGQNILIIDVGTNAEIYLGNGLNMYSASSPTGPAFEGAQITFGMRAAPGAIERVRINPITYQPDFQVIGESRWASQWTEGDPTNHLATGICGSGIIEVIAELYLCGIILPDGRFNPDIKHQNIIWDGKKASYVLASSEKTAMGTSILVTQEDIRNIQLAKAALYAGAKLLMNRAKIPVLDKIILAGAFGSYIDTKYAMVLGLIPNCKLENVYAVGNAAGDGARIALLNTQKRDEAMKISQHVRYIETAVDAEFQEEFVSALHIPHMNDQFPELSEILPAQTQNTPLRARKRKHHRES